MVAILTWFASFLFSGFAKELLRRALIFVTFNIVLTFIIGWLTSHSIGDGLNPLTGGSAVGNLLSGVGPMVLYVFDCLWVVPGLYLVLNAKLWRMTARLTVQAVTAG